MLRNGSLSYPMITEYATVVSGSLEQYNFSERFVHFIQLIMV